MERSLDPDLLGLALGDHENLPTPQTLSELMTQVELAILVGEQEFPDEILAVGWYLHGIATSKYALQTYGIDRQRAAFQVSGHLFDLLLQSRELSIYERLKYVFASQIAYIRGGINPNAIAIYRREGEVLSDTVGLVSDAKDVALVCGVALLGYDVSYVYSITESVRNEADSLVSDWEVDSIQATPFGVAAGVASGTRDILSFLVYGNQELLERSRRTLSSVLASDAPMQDDVSRWVAAHLLNVSDNLANSSPWTVLPPDVPPRVRKAFVHGSPRILSLWPPQLDLLGVRADDVVHPLSNQAKRLVISTPTSGGKTTISQMLIASYLSTDRSFVCYVAPTRTLCREVRKGLEDRLRFLAREVADDLPEDAWSDLFLSTPPAVEVMTPERLSYLIRSDAQRVLSRFGMFVFDEVHLIGEQSRGWTLEAALTYLHHATKDTSHRIILISAAIGNRNHFLQWMSLDDTEPIYTHSEWRGPRRMSAIFTTDPDWTNSVRSINRRAPKNPCVQETPLYGLLQVRISHTGATQLLRTESPIGSLVMHGPDFEQLRKSSKSTSQYRMLLSIIDHLAAMGPVLVIESTKQQTLLTARAIAELRSEVHNSQIQRLVDLVQARLGDHPLCGVLRKGVGYHHGALPAEIRAAIEDAVSEGVLRILVATTTMTEGVNLPVQSVVIAAQGTHTSQGYEEFIIGPKLVNAIGRAGRATKETEGIVVLARFAAPDPSDMERLNPSDADMQITSMLARDEALADLAIFESIQQESQDAVFEVLPRTVSDFLQFVWFLAAGIEELDTPTTLQSVENVLRSSLGWLQASPVDKGRWIIVAGQLLNRFNATEPSTRRRWATTGASLNTSRQLETIAQELAEVCRQISIPSDLNELFGLVFGDGRLDRILNLSDAPSLSVFDTRGGQNRSVIPINMVDFLHDWIEGESLQSLSIEYFSEVSDIDFRFEQLGNYLNEYCEIFLPWVLGVLTSWTNSLLSSSGSSAQLPTDLSTYVRYGVNNLTAIQLMIQGILSRSLAQRISEAATRDEVGLDLRAWVRSMDLSEMRQTFDASPAELRNLLDFARDRTGGIAAQVLTDQLVTLNLPSEVEDHPLADAVLLPTDETELPVIEVRVENHVVAYIPTHLRSEIMTILDIGLSIEVSFSAKFGNGVLRLRLAEPE